MHYICIVFIISVVLEQDSVSQCKPGVPLNVCILMVNDLIGLEIELRQRYIYILILLIREFTSTDVVKEKHT